MNTLIPIWFVYGNRNSQRKWKWKKSGVSMTAEEEREMRENQRLPAHSSVINMGFSNCTYPPILSMGYYYLHLLFLTTPRVPHFYLSITHYTLFLKKYTPFAFQKMSFQNYIYLFWKCIIGTMHNSIDTLPEWYMLFQKDIFDDNKSYLN